VEQSSKTNNILTVMYTITMVMVRYHTFRACRVLSVLTGSVQKWIRFGSGLGSSPSV